MCEFCPILGRCNVCNHFTAVDLHGSDSVAVAEENAMTGEDWITLLGLIEKATNDEVMVRCHHKRLLIENKAVALECETALEEFVGWFKEGK